MEGEGRYRGQRVRVKETVGQEEERRSDWGEGKWLKEGRRA